MSLASSGLSVSSIANTKKQLWVLQDSGFVPLAIFPQGFNTNGLTIIKATESQVDAITEEATPESSTVLTPSGGGFFTPMDAGGAGPGQSASSNGAKGAIGTVGICYQQYLNTGISTHGPLSGFPPPLQFVMLDGSTGDPRATFSLPKLLSANRIAKDFRDNMKALGYFSSFYYGNDDVKINDLKKTSEGGNSIFNTVNFGLFIGHGDFGFTAENDSVKYTYTWIMNLQNGSVADLRFSDLDFGSAGTNGLRWMTFISCDTLNQTCYNSMKNATKLPINSNLHLFLGASTIMYLAPDLGLNYAAFLADNETIIDAWVNTGKLTYTYQNATNMTGQIVKFAHAGSSNCTLDTLTNYFTPSGGITFGDEQVYP